MFVLWDNDKPFPGSHCAPKITKIIATRAMSLPVSAKKRKVKCVSAKLLIHSVRKTMK